MAGWQPMATALRRNTASRPVSVKSCRLWSDPRTPFARQSVLNDTTTSLRKPGQSTAMFSLGRKFILFGLTLAANAAFAQDPSAIRALDTSVKPLAPNTSDLIRDRVAAQQLGKALFWDVNAGSDGTACATC